MMKEKILIICAHPDDAELECGGFILKHGKHFDINVLIMTDGTRGSNINLKGGKSIKQVRRDEACDSAAFGDFLVYFESFIDGELVDSIEIRNVIVSYIRKLKPAAIFTHRDNDYHPDHRCISRMVQDSLVAIYCDDYLPEIPAINYIPAVLFFWNRFEKPNKFSCDFYVDITDIIEEKRKMIQCHKSQFPTAESFTYELYEKNRIINQLYGSKNGRFGEAFELCQYLRDCDRKKYVELFMGLD